VLLGREPVADAPARLRSLGRPVDVSHLADELQLTQRLGVVHQLLAGLAQAVEELPVGDLRLPAMPGEELGEQPSGVLLGSPLGGIRGHAGGQGVRHGLHAGIGFGQLRRRLR
jgi:hypothetical protein